MTLFLTTFLPLVAASQNYNLSTSSLTPSTVTAILSPTTAIVKTTTYLTVPYNGPSSSAQVSPPNAAIATSAAANNPSLQNHGGTIRANTGMTMGFALLASMVIWFYLIV